MIIDGLPPGTTIELTPIMTEFVCPGGSCGVPGGSLGGEIENFEALMIFQLRGTGMLDGFRRNLRVPLIVETHTGPRNPGDPVQTFDTLVHTMTGNLPPGDPDFMVLTIIAGMDYGLPSPGITMLTDQGDGTFQVDSFFDITYQIDFVGAPGSILDGLGGATVGTVRMEAMHREPKAREPDRGDGTITLPPLHARYMGLTDDAPIIDGLPPGTTIELEMILKEFYCDPADGCGQPGGALGGEVESFTAVMDLVLRGTGSLLGFQRELSLPATVETHSASRILGPHIQRFDTDMASLAVALHGDPDFDTLTIIGGSNYGMPGPGETTLTPLGAGGGGGFHVDSFFDIHIQIDFVGAPGSVLEGMAGITHCTPSWTAFFDYLAKPYRLWMPLVVR
jgi:hypothetical protein